MDTTYCCTCKRMSLKNVLSFFSTILTFTVCNINRLYNVVGALLPKPSIKQTVELPSTFGTITIVEDFSTI